MMSSLVAAGVLLLLPGCDGEEGDGHGELPSSSSPPSSGGSRIAHCPSRHVIVHDGALEEGREGENLKIIKFYLFRVGKHRAKGGKIK